jgi:phospholipid N-methyltransferase
LLSNDKSLFFKRFLKNPSAVGAVLPSSSFLASEILKQVDWQSPRSIAEIGPGTGPVTQAILERSGTHTRFFAVEIDPQFAEHLKKRFPGVDIQCADACQLADRCAERNIPELDAVISGLPWAVFPKDLQLRLLAAINDSLGPRGTFSTFAYLHRLWLPAGLRFRGLLNQHFRSVEISPVVWRNSPPAIVYHCRKS